MLIYLWKWSASQYTMCFIMTSPVLSHPPVDSGCKNKNQAKREKRRPPGTVEFIVSETAPVRLGGSGVRSV